MLKRTLTAEDTMRGHRECVRLGTRGVIVAFGLLLLLAPAHAAGLDGQTLYVAIGGENAIAVVDLAAKTVEQFPPAMSSLPTDEGVALVAPMPKVKRGGMLQQQGMPWTGVMDMRQKIHELQHQCVDVGDWDWGP